MKNEVKIHLIFQSFCLLTKIQQCDKMAGRLRLPRPEFPLYHHLSNLSIGNLTKSITNYFPEFVYSTNRQECNNLLYYVYSKERGYKQCIILTIFLLRSSLLAENVWKNFFLLWILLIFRNFSLIAFLLLILLMNARPATPKSFMIGWIEKFRLRLMPILNGISMNTTVIQRIQNDYFNRHFRPRFWLYFCLFL